MSETTKTVNFTDAEESEAQLAYKDMDVSAVFEGEFIASWISEISYRGFNPIHTIAAFTRIAKAKPLLETVERDLGFLIMVFMERGSDIIKLTNPNTCRMTEEGRSKLTAFKDQYKLLKGSRGQSSTALTLSRIAAAYPYHSCYYAEWIRKNHPITTGLPRCMEIGAFAALLPSAESCRILDKTICGYLWDEHKKAMIELSKVINKDFSTKSEAEQLKEVNMYCNAAAQNRLLTEEEKIERLVQLKVLIYFKDKYLIFGKLASVATKKLSAELVVSKTQYKKFQDDERKKERVEEEKRKREEEERRIREEAANKTKPQ